MVCCPALVCSVMHGFTKLIVNFYIDENVKQLELSYSADGNVSEYSHPENSLAVSYKIKHIPMLLLGFSQRSRKDLTLGNC